MLDSCLGSLRRQKYPKTEVLVVDDASTDESVALVRSRYPDVRLITLAQNCGFAAAANVGMSLAAGEIIALLNNDAEADPEWLLELVKALEEDPLAGIATSKVLLYDRRDIIHSAGDLLRRDGLPGNRGVWERDYGQYDEPGYVFGGCGAAVAYRREMLEDIGLFDERFGSYLEDVDLAWRARLAGWRCLYVPAALVRHAPCSVLVVR